MNNKRLLHKLPSVQELLQRPAVAEIIHGAPRSMVVDLVRQILEESRQQVLKKGQVPAINTIENQIISRVNIANKPQLRRVINATGVVLHTNLGRAVLSKAAVDAVSRVASGYSNLEYNLEQGNRGSRHSHIEQLLSQVTGAAAAMVVNNNAAAVLLVLSALARGKEAIVSRGELVEIGGAFRIPEVMEQSGTYLREVGTTNKTYPRDYQAAINDNTGLLLKVHTSNYRVVGFTHETTREDLVAIGKQFDLPVVEDLGSGSLVDLSALGIGDEPSVQQCVSTEIDLVTFSGDKLLGGPQAGFIVGRKDLIEKLKNHPLARALRVDKMTIAALEATLRIYLEEERAREQVPTLNMLLQDVDTIKSQAEGLAEQLKAALADVAIKVIPGHSRPGGGSLPTTKLETWLVSIGGDFSAEAMAVRLRQAQPAVLVRIQEDCLLIDPRTLLNSDGDDLVQVVAQCLRGEN